MPINQHYRGKASTERQQLNIVRQQGTYPQRDASTRKRSGSVGAERRRPVVHFYSPQLERRRSLVEKDNRTELVSVRPLEFENGLVNNGPQEYRSEIGRIHFSRQLKAYNAAPTSSTPRISNAKRVNKKLVDDHPLKIRLNGATKSSSSAREPIGATSHLATADPPVDGPNKLFFSPSKRSQESNIPFQATKKTSQRVGNGPPPTPRRYPSIERPQDVISSQKTNSSYTAARGELYDPLATTGLKLSDEPPPTPNLNRNPLSRWQRRSSPQIAELASTPARHNSSTISSYDGAPRPIPCIEQLEEWGPSLSYLDTLVHSADRRSIFREQASLVGKYSTEDNEECRSIFPHISKSQIQRFPLQMSKGRSWALSQQQQMQENYQVQFEEGQRQINSSMNQGNHSIGLVRNFKLGESTRSLTTDAKSQRKTAQKVRMKSDDECPTFFSTNEVFKNKSIIGGLFDWIKRQTSDNMNSDDRDDEISHKSTEDTEEAPPDGAVKASKLDRHDVDRISTTSEESDDVYLISKPEEKKGKRRCINFILCFIVLCFCFSGIMYYRAFTDNGKGAHSLGDFCVSSKLVEKDTPREFNNSAFSEHFYAMAEIIRNATQNGTAFEIPDSPQRKALCWLSDSDDQELDAIRSNNHALFQRYIIGVLRFALGIQSNKDPQNLNSSDLSSRDVHECQWHSTICNGDNQVTALLLGDASLQGQIPHEIANLRNLTFLDLSLNRITGIIPPSIGKLEMLEYLSLAFNDISSTIPEEVSNLSRLEFLNLRSSKVSGTIPESLGELKRLKTLLLEANLLSGTIPSTLGNLHEAQEFRFRKNSLSGSTPKELCSLRNQSMVELRVDAWVDCGCCTV